MKFLTLIAVVALMWLTGLFVFAERVREFTPAPDPARADAVVSLTGPSAERVNAAIRHALDDVNLNQLIGHEALGCVPQLSAEMNAGGWRPLSRL